MLKLDLAQQLGAQRNSSKLVEKIPRLITPIAKLICCSNSHQFEDRTLHLDGSVKIGRTVVKAQPDLSNAIFDCKVLSRNHALLWYDDITHNFYIQDTKSSNGTFVNNDRLSKSSDESDPRIIYSGDILQFGVEVMEGKNAHKVAHGCIIAKIQLILPDGKEPMIEEDPSSLSELYELNQHIQEALAREQLLETKLNIFQRILHQTETASTKTWQALIDEDRLLSRIEILERQLAACASKNDDKLKEELKWYLEEKEIYQQTAKITLKKLVDEKLEAVKSVKDLRSALIHTEDEFATLRQLYDRDLLENQQLTRQHPLKQPFVEHKEVLTDPIEPIVLGDPQKDNDKTSIELEETNKLVNTQQDEIKRLKVKLGQLESVLSELKVGPLSGENDDSFNIISSAVESATKEGFHHPNLKELQLYEENLIQAEKKIAKLILVKESTYILRMKRN
ncbi:Sarcolemmal membrane-associated protein [Lepeophtheirus salmonis]|uniref:Sarcolemmal membrane-associated protein n=1 Tax=Lepeophtheirus salmonis TaxID=72036 RepID=A0A7R8D999_LEPSM|nr:Sarcolemmal membrane-associated protein [Lepeophtheirus salmonis]CAF3016101.1 Sarcolemmal membrane-associated protein [Lepeophtheirus salmonis]